MIVMNRIACGAATVLAFGVTCRAARANSEIDANTPPPETPQTFGAARNPENDTAASETPHEGTRRVDHFRIGVLGGVAFPRPLAFEGFVKIEKLVGLGFEYGMLPGITVSGVNTHFWALAADARVFPFKNAFFVGLRAGRQHLGGNADVTMSGYPAVNESMSMDSTFVNPRIGFLWTWEPGISLGVDIGVQIPVSTTSSSSLPPGTPIDPRITRVENTLGRYALPTVDLLQIGVLL